MPTTTEDAAKLASLDSKASEDQLKVSRYKFYKPTTWFHAPKTVTYSDHEPECSKLKRRKSRDLELEHYYESSRSLPVSGDNEGAAGASTLARPPGTGPPAGYVWVWLGSFKRWKRRFLQADTLGLLVIRNKRRSARQTWTLRLDCCRTMFAMNNQRQFAVQAKAGTIYVRTKDPSERAVWVQHIKASSETFNKMLAKATAAMPGRERFGTPHFDPQQAARAEELVQVYLQHLQRPFQAVANSVYTAQTDMARALSHLQSNPASSRPFEQHAELGPTPPAQPAPHKAWRTPSKDPALSRYSTVDTSLQQPLSTAFVEPAQQAPSAANVRAVRTSNLGHSRSAAAIAGPQGAAAASELASRLSSPTLASAPKLLSPERSLDVGKTPEEGSSGLDSPTSLSVAGKQNLGRVGGGASVESCTHDGLEPSDESVDFNLEACAGTSAMAPFGQDLTPYRGEPPPDDITFDEAWAWLQRDTRAVIQRMARQIVELEVEASALEGAVEHHLTHTESFESFDTARSTSSLRDEFSSSGHSLGARKGSLRGAERSVSRGSVPGPAESARLYDVDMETQQALEAVWQVQHITKSMGREAEGERKAALDRLAIPPEHDDQADSGGSQASVSEASEDEDTRFSSPGSHTQRANLPHPAPLSIGISIWGILKNAIGKDLTRITLPATINEPLSGLQRFAEELEYVDFIERASQCEAPEMRMLWMTLFAVAPINSMVLRDRKPFNPLLGETFEWSSPSGAHRLIVEQVSHHPPVACMAAEGPAYTMSVEMLMCTSFWGKSVEISSKGGLCATLTGYGDEQYAWNKPNVSMNNIIWGRPWLEVNGDVNLDCSSGYSSTVTLHKCKGKLQNRGRLSGEVRNAAGEVLLTLEGSVMDAITATAVTAGAARAASWPINTPQRVYQRLPLPADSAAQFNLTRFAIALNDPRDPSMPFSAPTDSRKKPDCRALENADYALATSEKYRLEDKQRAAAKERKAAGEAWTPRWFVKQPADTEELVKEAGLTPVRWACTNKYWAKREAQDWAECPDIY